ncbi:MAG TPA: glutamine cyclotransferase [Alphaproteobacteria bacterium]|nr:glutamine cyclotransferase [Alphaproteobacteria bacterium]
MKTKPAAILREYGPFDGIASVHGVSFDGEQVWFGSGDKLNRMDPASGAITRRLDVPAQAGTAFDGTHLYQIADGLIRKVDPQSGAVLGSIPTPCGEGCSGMAWAEGALWIGEYKARKIHQVDPATGKIIRSIASDRFVTGVSWLGSELWHGTWENDECELRHVDAASGDVLESLAMPPGAGLSGLESDGKATFYCGTGPSGKLRAVKR